jgi:hypothetical protein
MTGCAIAAPKAVIGAVIGATPEAVSASMAARISFCMAAGSLCCFSPLRIRGSPECHLSAVPLTGRHTYTGNFRI